MQPEGSAPTPGGPETGGGPLGNLPSKVPDGVQNLLEGIFNWGGDMGRGFGEFVSGLANAITGGGSGAAAETPAMLVPHAVDQFVTVTGVVA
jgi:hypothetical protein